MDEKKVCKCVDNDIDRINYVKENMINETKLYDLAELFKIFGDSTRIKIISVLMQYEMCVCDIASTLNMTQSAISHQLRYLKASRLIKNRKEGKQVYYSLKDEHVREIFKIGLEHIEEIF